MASNCCRTFNRASISNLKSVILKPNLKASTTSFSRTPSVSSPLRRFFVSRTPGELGSVASMLPLHSAVAMARMTSCLSPSSRCCRALSQDETDGTFCAIACILIGSWVYRFQGDFACRLQQRVSSFEWVNYILSQVHLGTRVTVFQSLFMKGVSLTSPAMATAMPNLAPGLIFCIAWAFRLEKIELASIYSRAKIAGTFLCVVGALLMSLMQSTVQYASAKEAQVSNSSSPPNNTYDEQTLIGCMYLIAAIFVLSSQIVLQATTLRDFPAPISLCAITSLIGVVLTTMVQMIEDNGWDTGWPLLTIQQLIGYSLLAGSVSGMCVSFNGWAMKKRGPVMVSIFNPLATVISVALSVITLGESISIGSLAGMCLMFTGLYFVLWAKGNEGFSIDDHNNSVESEHDVEKPLLC